MKTRLQKQLNEKAKELQDIIDQVSQELRECPEGSLRISANSSGAAYYFRDKNECGRGNRYQNGSYISKKKMDAIKQLAQKAYNEKVLAWARRCQKHLEKFMNCYTDDKLDQIYTDMAENRRKLVTPVQQMPDDRAEKWRKQEYEGKPLPNDIMQIYTENGEQVRSKSEKILADKFAKEGIPYRYEYPLKLKEYGVIYPDFTLLDKMTGEEYYWEHFGMMDDPEYVSKAIKKIETYEKNGIFPGKKLILTFETSKGGFRVGQMNALIYEYFRKE